MTPKLETGEVFRIKDGVWLHKHLRGIFIKTLLSPINTMNYMPLVYVTFRKLEET